MQNEKTKRRNWLDTNPFFGCKEGYEIFVESMMTEADAGNLPLTLECRDPEILTMQDIQELSLRFKEDAGLDIQFQLFTCDQCEKLHCILTVDDPFLRDKEETANVKF